MGFLGWIKYQFIGENNGDIPKISLENEGVKNVDKSDEHQHEWKFIAKTYGAPRSSVGENGQQVLERALFGITTFLWECVMCKNLRKEELLGSEGSQLEDMLVKAEQFGPQYVQRDRTTFIIAKYSVQQQQQSTQPGYIPLK